MNRHLLSIRFLAPILSTLLIGGCAMAEQPADFFSTLRDRVAAGDAEHAPAPLPEHLLRLDYDQYRKIAPRAWQALWRDSGRPFEIGFYHPGYLFPHPVEIYTLSLAGEQRVPFDAGHFDYFLEGGAERWAAGLKDYAGFYALHPFDGGPTRESLSFLGASYFRALGSNHIYGSSCRALAIDTALSRREEFPRFVRHWIAEPGKGDPSLTAFSEMTSDSASGAWQFVYTPGETSTMQVRGRILVRRDVEKLGMAPITSMFWSGPADPLPSDPRPRVHDAQGLLIHGRGGEWLWRPLVRPDKARTSQFAGDGVTGFGLIQRDHEFHEYMDTEALYDRRPSVWIDQLQGFGRGYIELYEIQSGFEGEDNINAYWVADGGAKAGTTLDISYRITWMTGDPAEHTGTRAKRVERHEDELRLAWLHPGTVIDGLEMSGIVTRDGGETQHHAVHREGDHLVYTIPALKPGETIRTHLKVGNDYSETVVYGGE